MGNVKTATTTARGTLVRKPRAGKLDKTVVAVVTRPASMADAITIAKTITPDTFGDVIRAANVGHGIAHGGRSVNRFDSTRIEFTQNRLYADNVTNQLTDVQLLAVWCMAFPMATGRVFDANRATDDKSMRDAIITGTRIVRNVRGQFNNGKHANAAPAAPIPSFGPAKIAFTAPAAPAAK